VGYCALIPDSSLKIIDDGGWGGLEKGRKRIMKKNRLASKFFRMGLESQAEGVRGQT